MEVNKMTLLIVLILIAVIAIFIISTYNGLVKAKMNVDNNWSQIDVQLQRRFDLIPNFVETVKGYMTHHGQMQPLSVINQLLIINYLKV